MTTRTIRFLALAIGLAFGACNNEFSINAPPKDVYALQCILRNDQAIQYAVVSKNYFTDNGGEPAPNTIEPNIAGLAVTIYNNDSVFVMRDTTIEVTTAEGSTRMNCYYVKHLTISPGHVVRIEASVPGGTVLKSSIHAPQLNFDKTEMNFPQLFKRGYWMMPFNAWSWIVDGKAASTIVSRLRLEVHYRKRGDNARADNKILVPLTKLSPFGKYDTLITATDEFSFKAYQLTTIETIHKTMRDISGDDMLKENYIITKVLFNIIALDQALTIYYYAGTTTRTEFSIKLRQPEVSNIEGGTGIFGLYGEYLQPLKVDRFYIEGFGYQYDPS